MRQALVEVVEGSNETMSFGLNQLVYGSTAYTPIVLTGMEVSVILRDGRGVLVRDSTANVEVTGSTSGVVAWSPTTSDFVAAYTPYTIRFMVEDSTGAFRFFPNEDGDLIKVNPR